MEEAIKTELPINSCELGGLNDGISIRAMRFGDCKRVWELAIGLQRHQKMVNLPRLPTVEELQSDLFGPSEKQPNHLGTFCAVAEVEKEQEKRIIGYIMYHYAYSIIEGRRMYVTSFFIEEDYRRSRVGQRLMGYVIRHCHAVGITRVDVPFMKSNKAGFSFYSKYGVEIVDDEYRIFWKSIADV